MYRILIVDDTPANIKLLNDILRNTYRISVAISGRDALDIARKEPPDMILLDIMMPEMDGYEVCQRLKASAETANIPIIFITAKTEIEDEQYGLELGAVDYITKPISPPITLARIKNHLELKQARDHLEELVTERTRQLQRKVDELEARDRLVRFQMQSPDVHVAGREILKEISELLDTDELRLFSPNSYDGSLELQVIHEQSGTQPNLENTLETEEAQNLVGQVFMEKKLRFTAHLIASPILYQQEILGVILVAIKAAETEQQDDMIGVLWRMANEAAMVLRMVNLTEEIKNDGIDFDSLLDMAEKNL